MRFVTSLPLVILCALVASLATAAERQLVVGAAEFPPNVIQSQAGDLEGFDIDLWKEIARANDFDYRFEFMPFEQLLAAVGSGQVDLALAGITINGTRESTLDFSHPYMQSGIRILTRTDADAGVGRYVSAALDSGAASALLYLLGFILVCAHVLFLAERGSASVSRAYFPGILEAAWCIAATMTTVGYGDITPHKWLGRLVAFVVMITGIGLFGVLIADLSSGLTLQELRTAISTPGDLAGLRVATVSGSTSVAVARGYGALVDEADDVEAAIELLRVERVDAVVFDGPPLLQYLKQNPRRPYAVVGPRLDSEMYGVAFPDGSPLREPVNRTLLELEESGERSRLYEKWFGPPR